MVILPHYDSMTEICLHRSELMSRVFQFSLLFVLFFSLALRAPDVICSHPKVGGRKPGRWIGQSEIDGLADVLSLHLSILILQTVPINSFRNIISKVFMT
jgi:hypothetical protein